MSGREPRRRAFQRSAKKKTHVAQGLPLLRVVQLDVVALGLQVVRQPGGLAGLAAVLDARVGALHHERVLVAAVAAIAHACGTENVGRSTVRRRKVKKIGATSVVAGAAASARPTVVHARRGQHLRTEALVATVEAAVAAGGGA